MFFINFYKQCAISDIIFIVFFLYFIIYYKVFYINKCLIMHF